MKKCISLLLCLTLMAGVCAFAAAEEPVTYRTLYSGEVTTLNYLVTSSTNEFGLAANLIDTLVEYDNYGQIQPSLADKWNVSDDGLTYTFHIRDGATWVKADGTFYANVTADDFVAAAQYILDAKHASSTADILYGAIQNAETYYLKSCIGEEEQALDAAAFKDKLSEDYDDLLDAAAFDLDAEAFKPYVLDLLANVSWDDVGIQAPDSSTLVYTLKKPIPYFLSMLTYVCFMPVNAQFLAEAGDGFGLATGNDTILYNGAYVLDTFLPQEKTILAKNPTYWDADKVYIEKIEETYNKEAANVAPQYFLDGNIDGFGIDNAMAAEWLADPEKADFVRPVRQYGQYSAWYSFDYNPAFEEEYEPENWKIAVANENFRQSIFHGLDRVKATLNVDPINAEELLYNTITPTDFATYKGTDYVNMGELAAFSAVGADTFNEELALEYKAKAVEELTAAGATFPIKMKMMYNVALSWWADECQTVEQQLEGLLGTDYIDIIIVSGANSGFLGNRRQGNYAFMKVNWGADYADPETYTDPFDVAGGNSYRFTDTAIENVDLTEYKELLAAAKAITGDTEARYLAFAKAEAYLIEHAYMIPMSPWSGGYTVSKLDTFTSQYAPFGISQERYKGQKMLDHPMSTDEYYDAYDAWQEAREALATAE
ncbi:MAG: peptide ABC transporter substrate-binding protein [Clostridia bacterium]|nr:peptide ABC transporter substrate-binding protein [Clostridia bacterium]